jgi:peptidylprolyl isomerase
VRRRRALTLVGAAVAPLLLVLAACSSASSGGAASAGATPTVSGAFGTKPTITLPSGAAPSTLQTTVVSQGSGAKVVKGDLLIANYSGELWRNGTVFDTSFGKQPASFAIGTGQVIPGWDKSLVGQTAGSRMLLVIPPADGYGSSGQSAAGIKGDDTLVFVVDIIASVNPKASASGTPGAALPPTLPAVSTASGQPTVTVPKTAAPSGLVIKTVVQGTGQALAKNDLAILQYTGMLWRTGKTFDSSWQRGVPIGITVAGGQAIKGFDLALPGIKVGSRVLLIIPPADGYGAAGNTQAGINGTDVMVFVVDVVGTYH